MASPVFDTFIYKETLSGGVAYILVARIESFHDHPEGGTIVTMKTGHQHYLIGTSKEFAEALERASMK